MTAATDEGYTIERHFDAPRELVWQMWTKPEHFSYWWGGTSVLVPLDSIEMDVRVGGKWKATMVGPDAAWTIDWTGEYLEVDEPTRLVMTLTDVVGDTAREGFTIDFSDEEGGTHMTLTQSGGHLSAEQYEATRQGTDGFMDALAQRLAEVQK